MENFAKFLAVLVVVPVVFLGFFLVLGSIIDFGTIFSSGNRQSANVDTASYDTQSEIRAADTVDTAADELIVAVKDIQFVVEVANTPAERRQGLSGRPALPSNEGLLFVFDESDRHGIWMKDMHFAIDIIWLDENKRAVDFKENAKPETYPETFYPEKNAAFVIEVPAGFVERNNIRTGDFFVFTASPPSR